MDDPNINLDAVPFVLKLTEIDIRYELLYEIRIDIDKQGLGTPPFLPKLASRTLLLVDMAIGEIVAVKSVYSAGTVLTACTDQIIRKILQRQRFVYEMHSTFFDLILGFTIELATHEISFLLVFVQDGLRSLAVSNSHFSVNKSNSVFELKITVPMRYESLIFENIIVSQL
ncbi:hypothetical protein BY458DRAFT_492176 [Sporodiniella umbellata]|nr:hypothetical protein BY458DRAFT_492176 [Sporodiniella umbellata]